ncbi:MAG TPA: ACT domain-containing protein, partial [Methylomirabilota bacterium]|nr:ACT domain-containing protein [Methylomirabilota bacterium]
GSHVGPFYLRLMVVDRPGVIAEIAAIMRDEHVSMETMIQRARAPGDRVPVVLTTHETSQAQVSRVVNKLGSVSAVLEPPHVMSIEQLS